MKNSLYYFDKLFKEKSRNN